MTADDQTVELTDNAAALVLLALANAEALNAIDVFKAVAHFAVGKAHLEFRHSTPATGS